MGASFKGRLYTWNGGVVKIRFLPLISTAQEIRKKRVDAKEFGTRDGFRTIPL